MKKLLLTLTLAAASLLMTDQVSASSWRSYAAQHSWVASKPALRSSPHVRLLMHHEQVAARSDSISHIAASHNDAATHHNAVGKPGNLHRWQH